MTSRRAGPARCCVDGLWISGQLTAQDLETLTVAHCTVDGGLRTTGTSEELAVGVQRSLLGAVRLGTSVPALTVADSVVATPDTGAALDARGAAVSLDGVTVLGRSRVRQLSASDCIFTGVVMADRTQAGCVRYSALAPGSVTPRRYRCPDGVRASFTSETPGDPGYAQLGRDCPDAIAAGAEDGSEMGAFRFLRSPQRVQNLLASLDEYLRFGLDAALIAET